MSGHKNRKNKEHPNYQFLVSWKPQNTHVKGEPIGKKKTSLGTLRHSKSADSMAQGAKSEPIKKAVIKSLILISLILILELVVYLAWNKFGLN